MAAQQFVFENYQISLNGDYASNGYASMCVDIPGGNFQAGNKLQLWECNGMPGQQWGYDYDGMSVYASASTGDASMCLDIEGGSSTPGSAVWIWDCNHDLEQQRWYVPPTFGSFSVQSLRGDAFLCLDLLGQYTFNGNAIGAWECSGMEAQSWVFDADSWNIVWAKDRSKCVDVPGGNFQSGQYLQIWDCNGQDSQRFGYDSNLRTIYAAASADASLCLDVPRDEAAGASVWLWSCNGQDQQMWNVPNSYAWAQSSQSV